MKKNRPLQAWAIGIVLALTSVCAVHADEKKMLTAAEITELVSGNTLSGVFGEENTRYAQRNHRNGIAVVHIEGLPTRLIPWFVKEPGSYCEDWAEDGVQCFQISQDTSSGKHTLLSSDGTTSEPLAQVGFHPITFK